jgi:hypothetical protein
MNTTPTEPRARNAGPGTAPAGAALDRLCRLYRLLGLSPEHARAAARADDLCGLARPVRTAGTA